MSEYIIYNDWVKDRDKDTYVSRFDGNNKLGWENRIEKGKGFSSMIYNLDQLSNTKDLVMRSTGVARTRLNSMGIRGARIHLSRDQNMTNGKDIVVSTGVLDNTYMEMSKRMDVFLGEVVHEGAHILYTDFEVAGNNPSVSKIHRSLWNIIEDEFIERQIGKDFPGYSNYLAEVKAYIFSKKLEPMLGDEIAEIVNVFLGFIRYPKVLTQELVKKHEVLVDQISKLFEDGYPDSTQACFDKTNQVYNILKDYYEKPPEPENKKENKSSSKGGKGDPGEESEGDSKGDSEGEKEKDSGESDKQDSSDQDDPEDTEKESKPDDADADQSDEIEAGDGDSEKDQKDDSDDKNTDWEWGEDKEESEEEEGEEPPANKGDSDDQSEESGNSGGCGDSDEDQKDGENEKKDFDSDFDHIFSVILENTSCDQSEKSQQKSFIITDTLIHEIDGNLAPRKGNVFINVNSTDVFHYKNIRNVVKSSIATLSKQLEFDTFKKDNRLRGLRNGKLDESKIVEASMRIPTVYTTNVEKKTKGGSIILLIDESGSMDCIVDSVTRKKRIDIAAELAVLFHESLEKVGVEHFIYGHTADHIDKDVGKGVRVKLDKWVDDIKGSIITTYKERGKFNKNSLASICPQNCNRDGVAIRAVVDRVREFIPTDPLYLIVISDGSPNAINYTGFKDSRDAVIEVQSKGVGVIGIGIDVEYQMNKIYDHYVNFQDLSHFAKDVGKVIRKLIKTNF
jgi:nitric oxide reductase activation protein